MKDYMTCRDCGEPIANGTTLVPHLFKNEEEWELFKSLETDDEAAAFLNKRFDAIKKKPLSTFVLSNLLPALCTNCGCACFDAFVPLGAVPGATKESINAIREDKEFLKSFLPFGAYRFEPYVMLGYVYKRLGLKNCARIVLQEALYLEKNAPFINKHSKNKEFQASAIKRIETIANAL